MEPHTEEHWIHIDNCPASRRGEECDPDGTDFKRPPGWSVQEARKELTEEYGRELLEEIPWCRVHKRAWDLVAEQDRERA